MFGYVHNMETCADKTVITISITDIGEYVLCISMVRVTVFKHGCLLTGLK